MPSTDTKCLTSAFVCAAAIWMNRSLAFRIAGRGGAGRMQSGRRDHRPFEMIAANREENVNENFPAHSTRRTSWWLRGKSDMRSSRSPDEVTCAIPIGAIGLIHS